MRLVLVLLIALVFAAPAHAAPRALATVGENEGFVLSGDRVVFTETNGRKIRVLSMPLAGGAAQTIFTYTAPAGRYPYGEQLGRFAGAGSRCSWSIEDTRGATDVARVRGYGRRRLERRRRRRRRSTSPGRSRTWCSSPATTSSRSSAPGTASDEYDVAVYDPMRRVLPLPVGTLFNGDLAIRSERGPPTRRRGSGSS